MNALQRDLKKMVARVERADAPRAAADPARQRYHIMPPIGWLNDPNGLCKVGDTYHVFYQYGPFDVNGGVKHWGHATSTDLAHWQPQPPMLYPDEPFDCHGAYSGSALYDEGVLYLYYTGNVKHPGNFDYIKAGRGHNTCLATSRDGVTADTKQCLMTNADYPADLSCHVRDPKVFAFDGRWYMVQGARTLADKGEVLVFVSDDKLHWRHCNTITTPEPFGYMWECPDLFRLNGQWFLAVSPQGAPSQNVYACGYFPLYGDWRGECTLGKFREFDWGFDFYAPQSFEDGSRRLQLAWMGMPDAPYDNAPTVRCGWQHCLSVPCELTARGDRLLRNPAPELAALRGAGELFAIVPGAVWHGTACDLQCEILDPQTPFALTLRGGLELKFADGMLTLAFADSKIAAGRTVRKAEIGALHDVRVLMDESSAEIFVNGGETVLSTRFYPAPNAVGLYFTAGCGRAVVYEMHKG